MANTRLFFDNFRTRYLNTVSVNYETVQDVIEDANSDIPYSSQAVIKKATGELTVLEDNLEDFYSQVSDVDANTRQRIFKPVNIVLVHTKTDGTVLKSEIIFSALIMPKDSPKPDSASFKRKYNFSFEGYAAVDIFGKYVKAEVFTGSDLEITGNTTTIDLPAKADATKPVLYVAVDGVKIFPEEISVNTAGEVSTLTINTDLDITTSNKVKVVYITNSTTIV